MIFPEDDKRSGTRPRVKICGITHPEDAALAMESGADALGLNFYGGSPRCLDLSRDGGWLRALSGQVRRVGVVVNATHEFIRRLVGDGIVDAVQLHGDEDAEFCRVLRADGIAFIRALRVRGENGLLGADGFGAEHLLIDAYHPGAYGGTGQAVDWTLAARFVARHPGTILAGGLRPGNVAEAVRMVRPFGVDVASGVETDRQPGPPRKDKARMLDFFAALGAVGSEAVVSEAETQK